MIILGSIVFLLCGVILYLIIRQQKQKENLTEEIYQKILEERKEELQQKYAQEEEIFQKKKELIEDSLQQLEKRRLTLEQSVIREAKLHKQNVDTQVKSYRELEMQKARTDIQKDSMQQHNWAREGIELYWQELAEDTEKKEKELNEIKNKIEDYKKKQQAINEAILRQRELEEKQDFYRVKLTEDAKQDIRYLVSIIDNIKNPTLLYKLIWSEYIQKPFSTMLKNITSGKEIKCVIYKITNINTQEIYIGKTKADVTKRWTEHIKTSLNIGTVARSKIHDALFKHWDEFTFEILEEIGDESKLSQREKYYINFYQSNIYGYNMNGGG